MIISFAHTTPALLAGRKTVTRRDWSEKHAAQFYPGVIVDAWNYSPRMVKCNPHKIAEVEIVSIGRQSLLEMSESDYDLEGFAYLDEIGIECNIFLKWARCGSWKNFFDAWKTDRSVVYVVRFEVVKFLEGPLKNV